MVKHITQMNMGFRSLHLLEPISIYLQVLDLLAARGAQGVILGCTEIGLLMQQADTAIPLYDTTRIHAEQAVAHALA